MRRFIARFLSVFRSRTAERELAREIGSHLALIQEDFERRGLSPEEARLAALRAYGGVESAKELQREARSFVWIEQLFRDLRYGGRNLLRNRGFAAMAVLSLALGIGANTAIFSFMDAILLRALPVSDPESLVVLNWHAKATGRDFVMRAMSGSTWGDSMRGTTAGIFPFPAFELFRKHDSIFSTVFSTVFARCENRHVRRLNLTIKGQADLASGWNVSGDYFRGLGVTPEAGRLIIPDDDRPGAPPVAVVSYGFSQRRFGGAANAAGQPILIDNLPFTVVGVTPPEFFGVEPAAAPDVYLPLHTIELLGAGQQFGFRPEAYFDRNYYWIQIMGRLRPGVSRAQAQAMLAPSFQQWVASTAANDRERANLPALIINEGAGGLDSLRRQYSQPLHLLMTLVGLILVLACANTANLLLARRMALGAQRGSVLRMVMRDVLGLAAAGLVIGMGVALATARFVESFLYGMKSNDPLALSLAVMILLAAALLAGYVPAWKASRIDPMAAVRHE